jgi:hypothetical protein
MPGEILPELLPTARLLRTGLPLLRAIRDQSLQALRERRNIPFEPPFDLLRNLDQLVLRRFPATAGHVPGRL